MVLTQTMNNVTFWAAGMNSTPRNDVPLPDHLQRFPCMRPWIGSRYRDERHKRLLVIGESHYLPSDSTIHRDPGRWYRSRQDKMSGKEVKWACTVGNITGRWTKAHRIYREIGTGVAEMLQESGVTPDEFPLNHVAYCNYFLRPAPKKGGSMEGNAVPLDLEVAAKVLRWFILSHCPELVIATSRFAGRYAGKVTREYDLPFANPPQLPIGTPYAAATATSEAETCSATS